MNAFLPGLQYRQIFCYRAIPERILTTTDMAPVFTVDVTIGEYPARKRHVTAQYEQMMWGLWSLIFDDGDVDVPHVWSEGGQLLS